MGANDLDLAIGQSHAALLAIINGDPSGYMALYSREDDVTLGNPFGPFALGRSNVERTLKGASQNYSDGEVSGVDLLVRHELGGMACVVEMERGQAKIGGGSEMSGFALRVTSVFRLEHGNWKLVHRHADPISSPRPASSVISS